MTSSVGSAAGQGEQPGSGRRLADHELGLTASAAVGRGVGSPSAGGIGADGGTGTPRVRCLLVPLGATEQHGPHLPLATDTIIATAWATAAALRVDGVAVAPPLPYGSSGEHQDFPGTLSIGRDALERVIVELVRSAAHFCDRVVVVSAHGGNTPVLAPTITRLNAEGHRVGWVVPRWPAATVTDAHAGHTETSLLLHLRPDLVGSFDDVSGNTRPLSELLPILRSQGLAAVSTSGVLGDPRGATADHGAALFGHLVDSLVDHLSSAE